MERLTASLPVDSIVGDRYKITELLSDPEEETDLRYIGSEIGSPEKQVFIRELVFKSVDKFFRTELIEPLEKRILQLKNIRHPNLAPIVFTLSEDKPALLIYSIYIVYEFDIQNKKSLLQFAGENSEEIKDENIRTWGIQICDALKTLHNLNPPVIYYDLTPEYILLSEDGKILLYDYGFARMVKPSFNYSPYMGTPGYSAPEQYGIKVVDTRADIFAAGILLYYLITKEDPRKNPLKISPIKNYTPHKDLVELVTACLAFKAEDRIQKIEEVQKKLDEMSFEIPKTSFTIKKKEKIEVIKPEEVKPPFFKEIYDSLSWSATKFRIKYAKEILILEIVLLICLLGAVLLNFIAGKNKASTKLVIIGANSNEIVSIDTQNPDRKKLFKTDYNIKGEAILSRNGKYAYLTALPDLIYCFDMEKGQISAQIKVGSAPKGLSLSPVQNYLAVTGRSSGNITLIDVDFNNTVATIRSGGDAPVSVCFSSDGKKLFVVNKASRKVTAMELTGNILASIDVDGDPANIINTKTENKLYVTLWDKNEIIVLDSDKNKILTRISTDDGPSIMALCKPKGLVAVTCQKSQEILLISSRGDVIMKKIKLDTIPTCLTFSIDGEELYVGTSSFENTQNCIYLWDGKNLEKIATLTFTPTKILFAPPPIK